MSTSVGWAMRQTGGASRRQWHYFTEGDRFSLCGRVAAWRLIGRLDSDAELSSCPICTEKHNTDIARSTRSRAQAVARAAAQQPSGPQQPARTAGKWTARGEA